MASEMTENVHKAAGWSLLLSVLMIAAGILAVCAPIVAGVAVTAIVGWMLILSGGLHLAFAWRAGHASAVIWEILLGLIYLWIGWYMLTRPVAGLASITLVVATYLILEGILELVLGFRLRPASGSGWLLFDGVVTLVLAAMIWSTWPSSALWVVGTLVGISMFFSGISRMMLSLAVRRATA